jgi:predicted aconitase
MPALAEIDRALLAGAHGEAAAFAMELMVRYAGAVGAGEFIDVTRAHVDGCLYHGRAGLDFVERLVGLGGEVRVPTTLNVGSMDLIHPELYRGSAEAGAAGKRLMALHEALGCTPTYTCAPYQTKFRPRRGEHIAWGESNAIVFANSVIGARTARYGDFIDLAAALTGRVPFAGLHRPENRVGRILFRVSPEAAVLPPNALAVAVGALVGNRAGNAIPVIEGLPATLTEDDFKALGAVAASTGAVAMFHAVGLTPEAPDLATALGGAEPAETVELSRPDLDVALAQLSTADEGASLVAVSLGTPHFSFAEFEELARLLDGFKPAPGVDLYVNTSRQTYGRLVETGLLVSLKQARFTVVVDTCTYVTAVMRASTGVVMTNSGKWAHYAPGNLGVDVAFGTLVDCLNSAARGRVTRRRP